MKDIDKIIAQLQSELEDVNDLETLKQTRSKFIFKSSFLIDLKQKVRSVSKEEVPKIGIKITKYLELANKELNDKKNQIENNFFLEKRDNILLDDSYKQVELVEKKGSIHPLTIINFNIQDYFDKLNFNYKYSGEVEDEYYNFTLLNIPKDHPAREMQDTLYLQKKDLLLRTHVTNTTSRSMMENKNNNLKFYSIGNVFRNDDNDATHSFQFTQLDFFTTEKHSIANLKFTINGLLDNIFQKKILTRYRPSFFPFTEPSYEVDIICQNCLGKGCSVCSNSGWIEVLGSGMLHPNVFKNTKKDISSGYGFAAGIGVERLAMLKWNINDIRKFYINDIKFLKEFN